MKRRIERVRKTCEDKGSRSNGRLDLRWASLGPKHRLSGGRTTVAALRRLHLYSHAKDKPIAAALQSVIQKLGKPWYQRRALRVFRDDTSLSATPSLWPSIEQALGESRFLVLLASPEAAASPWVDKEVSF